MLMLMRITITAVLLHLSDCWQMSRSTHHLCMTSDRTTLRAEPPAVISRTPSSTSSLPQSSKQHQLNDVKLYRLLSVPLLSILLPGKFALARLDIPVSELSGASSSIRSAGTIMLSDGASAKDQFIDALATLILAKKVIEPTQNYVLIQKYDNARSNLQYVLNQLQLQKKVTYLLRNSVDYCDDIDAVEAAGEAGNRLTNTVLSFDNTVYTCVFIPTDSDDLGPTIQKYRKEANDFYVLLNSDIDTMLRLGDDQLLTQAGAIADTNFKALPPVLFKKY